MKQNEKYKGYSSRLHSDMDTLKEFNGKNKQAVIEEKSKKEVQSNGNYRNEIKELSI